MPKSTEGSLTNSDLKACLQELRNEWKADLQQEPQKITDNLQNTISGIHKDMDQLGERVTEILQDVQGLTKEQSDQSHKLQSLETQVDTLQLKCGDLARPSGGNRESTQSGHLPESY